MRKAMAIGAAAATSVLAAGAITVASASPSPSHRSNASTLQVFGLTQQKTVVDVNAEGVSPGDEFVLTQTLYRDGKQVGNDSIVNTYTDSKGASQCVFTMNLPAGQVTGQVLIAAGQKSFTAAITGGSRSYKTARGQVRVHLLPTGNIHFTVQLRPGADED